jgi:hypothetical protein
VRIARPILLVSTPIGVVFGLREAWRLAGPGMALLMAAMLAVVGALVWMTARVIRRERDAATMPQAGSPRSTGAADGGRGAGRRC